MGGGLLECEGPGVVDLVLVVVIVVGALVVVVEVEVVVAVVVVVVVVVVEVTRVLISITPGGTQLYTVLTTAWPSPDTSTWQQHRYCHHHHHHHYTHLAVLSAVTRVHHVSGQRGVGAGAWHVAHYTAG